MEDSFLTEGPMEDGEGHNTRRILLWISVAELLKNTLPTCCQFYFFGGGGGGILMIYC